MKIDLTIDQVQLLVEVLNFEIEGLRSCSIFENDDLKHEAMLKEMADLKEIVASFDDLLGD